MVRFYTSRTYFIVLILAITTYCLFPNLQLSVTQLPSRTIGSLFVIEITISLRVHYAPRQVYTHSTNALPWHSRCLKNLIPSPSSYGTGAIVISTMAIYVKQHIQYPAYTFQAPKSSHHVTPASLVNRPALLYILRKTPLAC
jgi:hypothetical protein